MHFLVSLSVSVYVLFSNFMNGRPCGGRSIDRDIDITDLLHVYRSGRGDQDKVKFPVQHLLIHALQACGLRDVGLVVVVPAVLVPGQGGRLGEAAE